MNGLVLNPGEYLLMEGAANKWQTIGSKGGKLYLSNQRLVFIAHAFNFGSKFDEIPLSDIATKGNTFNFKTSSNLISFNISIETKSGKKAAFVVTREQKDLWIDRIGQAIWGYVTQNISFPAHPVANADSAAPPAPQIKVVNCAGCGAWVLVTGNIAYCEYCGRPAV